MLKGLLASFAVAAMPIGASALPSQTASPQVVLDLIVSDLVDDGRLSVSTLEDVLGYDQISRFVLGRQGRRLSADEIGVFAKTYRSYLNEIISENTARFELDAIDVVSVVERRPNDKVVETRVHLDNGAGPDIVRWRFLKIDGRWKVIDIQISGVWLAIEQRAQVAALFDRHDSDLDAVLATFQDR